MSWHIIEGNWNQFKEHVKLQWNVLNDDQLDSIAGKQELLISKVQENYGMSYQEAWSQVRDWERRNQDLIMKIAATNNALPNHLQS